MHRPGPETQPGRPGAHSIKVSASAPHAQCSRLRVSLSLCPSSLRFPPRQINLKKKQTSANPHIPCTRALDLTELSVHWLFLHRTVPPSLIRNSTPCMVDVHTGPCTTVHSVLCCPLPPLLLLGQRDACAAQVQDPRSRMQQGRDQLLTSRQSPHPQLPGSSAV